MISIRINDDEKGILSVEGDLEGITLNALIGKIISKHIRWDRFVREIDSVCINKKSLTVLLESLDSTKIEQMCNVNSIISMKDAILFSKGNFTFENFLSVFDMWLDSSNISYRHISMDNFDRYIVKHGLGKNFSLFLNSLIEKILHELDVPLTDVNYNSEHISFEMDRTKAVT